MSSSAGIEEPGAYFIWECAAVHCECVFAWMTSGSSSDVCLPPSVGTAKLVLFRVVHHNRAQPVENSSFHLDRCLPFCPEPHETEKDS